MIAESPVTDVERYGGGHITICDYDPTWPAEFEQERTRLQTALGSIVTTIEHVGSTAVPGLAAKPIIDVLVGVRDLTEARVRCIEELGVLGYRYMAEYEAWLPGEMLFRKGNPGPWTHHAHVMDARVFQDDIAGFRDAKRPFLQALMAKARTES